MFYIIKRHYFIHSIQIVLKCNYSHKTYASVLPHTLLIRTKVHEEAESDRQTQLSVMRTFDVKHMVCSQAQKASYKVKASIANHKNGIAHENKFSEQFFDSHCI